MQLLNLTPVSSVLQVPGCEVTIVVSHISTPHELYRIHKCATGTRSKRMSVLFMVLEVSIHS